MIHREMNKMNYHKIRYRTLLNTILQQCKLKLL